MIHRTRMPSLEQTYELFDDPRYLEPYDFETPQDVVWIGRQAEE